MITPFLSSILINSTVTTRSAYQGHSDKSGVRVVIWIPFLIIAVIIVAAVPVIVVVVRKTKQRKLQKEERQKQRDEERKKRAAKRGKSKVRERLDKLFSRRRKKSDGDVEAAGSQTKSSIDSRSKDSGSGDRKSETSEAKLQETSG